MNKKNITTTIILLVIALFFAYTYQQSRKLAVSSGNYRESMYEVDLNTPAIVKSDSENAGGILEKVAETESIGNADFADKRPGIIKNTYPLLSFEYEFTTGLLDSVATETARAAKEKEEREKGAPRNVKVPQDYKTIQSAIDAAGNGYIVQVEAGEYKEKLVMKEGVSVIGESPAVTIIDAENSGNAVVFKNGITRKTRFSGFTVKNSGENLDGVLIKNSSPLIDNNIFLNNEYNIYIEGESAPLIQKNIIQFGSRGIQVYNSQMQDKVRPTITDNLITDNKEGIDLYQGSALIDHNTISYNNHYKTYIGPTYGINLSKSAAEIMSNIITDSGICDLCTGISADAESKNVVISFNDIWNNKNDFTCFGDCIMEGNNISEDPLFGDSINGTYKLKPESLLIGKGKDGSDIGVRW